MKIFFFFLMCAPAVMHGMMAGDSKREIEQLKRIIAEYGVDALDSATRQYFEEKGVNFSHLAIPQNNSSSGDYHRMIVEDFIKTFGKDAVLPAIRNQIIANGWHKESEIMAQFAQEPAAMPPLTLLEQHKTPLIILAAIAIGLFSYEIFASDDDCDEEKRESLSESEK